MTARRMCLFTLSAAALLTQAACAHKNRLQGNYVLVCRELPDGSAVHPPDIAGCMSYSEKYRNFNVMWKDAEGKPASISYLARYRLGSRRYTEHSVYRMTNNTPEGSGTTYDVSGPAASSDVQKRGDHLEFELPLYDGPQVDFCPCGFTARKAGVFVDYWKRVDD
jgi:hypothetical protein